MPETDATNCCYSREVMTMGAVFLGAKRLLPSAVIIKGRAFGCRLLKSVLPLWLILFIKKGDDFSLFFDDETAPKEFLIWATLISSCEAMFGA